MKRVEQKSNSWRCVYMYIGDRF